MPNIPPISGPSTESALPQAKMTVPAKNVLPSENEENARTGGRLETKQWEQSETRPQELHSSVDYQQQTADPGSKPPFRAYTDLTKPSGTVVG